MKTGKSFAVLFIIVFVFSIVFVNLAESNDELNLSGIVKSCDVKSGQVVIDVKSSSCPGIKRFNAKNARAFCDLMGEMVTFGIDSSMCKDNKVHIIRTLVRRGSRP